MGRPSNFEQAEKFFNKLSPNEKRSFFEANGPQEPIPDFDRAIKAFQNLTPEQKQTFVFELGLSADPEQVYISDAHPLAELQEKVIHEVRVFHNERRSSVYDIVQAFKKLQKAEQELAENNNQNDETEL